ncbi:MAG: Crp/Fnr family transcriptional regulator [Puia sp.]|nr:Crp/Fnr family transcriptional regulator [Puia sp.]
MPEIPCDLSRCFLCSSCIPEWREAVGIKKKTLLIKKGKHLFRENDPVEGIFFIYAGSVKVHKQWVDQKELILRFAKTGDIVGHRGLISNEGYPVSATALEDTTVCWVSPEFLEASLKTNPSLTYRLMQLYASELQKSDQRMRDLAHMDVKGRIAAALLEIADCLGSKNSNPKDNKFISITITRQDIASYAGTTYETVFKFFTELTDERIITTSGKTIRINKKERLLAIAHPVYRK